MKEQKIDIALLPVAAIPEIENARIISKYGIASDGNVQSVALFSQVPMNEIENVYLDYQSRTSIRLAKLLFEKHWKKHVNFLPASENYLEQIDGTTAGVIIGDRALQNLKKYPFVYDLSAAWKEYSGLDFVFAVWVSNVVLPADFIRAFDEANAYGLKNLNTVLAENDFPEYDLEEYYTKNIQFLLDDEKLKGLNLFFELTGNQLPIN
jgi:chorismate dehydratase